MKRDYQLLAQETLGLQQDATTYHLGVTRIEGAALEAVAVKRLQTVHKILRAVCPAMRRVEWEKAVLQNFFFPYHVYSSTVGNIKNIAAKYATPTTNAGWVALQQKYKASLNKPPPPFDPDNRSMELVEQLFAKIYDPLSHTRDHEGWRNYLRMVSPAFSRMVEEDLPVFIPEGARARHTYLVAKTGSGKSELLKRLIHPLITTNHCAAVVIDPAGEFAEQIAEWKENIENERFIYVHPLLQLGMTPIINPFEIQDVPASETSLEAQAVKIVIAGQIVEALQEIIAVGGGEFSQTMLTVLRPCVMVLMDYEGATLLDLMRFMNPERNTELVRFALTRDHYPYVKVFFEHSFGPKDNIPTRDAIRRKLQDLFTAGTFAALTCGKSTINLQKVWDEKKVIVFNLSKGQIGDTEAKTFGRLVVSLLQGIAKRRADVPEAKRITCHLFLDEMHNFTSESMKMLLLDSRRYKLLFTGCQQNVGAEMDADMYRAVIGNTDMKIGGQAAADYTHATAKLFPVDDEEVAALKQGEFIIRLGTNAPFKIKVATDLLGRANSMTPEQWEAVKADQLRRYYRPIQGQKPRIVPDAPEEPRPGPPGEPKTGTW